MDLGAPWGAYRVRGWSRLWLDLGHRLPSGYLGSRMGLLTRRLARLGHAGPIDIVLWGQRLRLDPRGGVSEARILFLPQFWDVGERAALADLVGPEFVFIDVGANVGGYTFWMASLLGAEGRVIAVEPDPALGDQLAFNIEASGSGERVRLIRAAVGDIDGEGVLILNTMNPGENRLAEAGELPGMNSVQVPVMRLSRIVEAAGFKRVDALKVDVEGGEKKVLEAFLTETPRTDWPSLLIVEVKGVSSGKAPLVKWLEEMGYRLETQTRLNGVFRLTAPLEGTSPSDMLVERAQG